MKESGENQDHRLIPRLYLIRGLPGSGKSTFANELGCIVIAPSDMMSHRGGKYHWIRENYMISKMHFREIVRHLMSLQIDICITELMLEKKFIEFWLQEAKNYYYQVHIKTLLIDLKRSENRNIHKVDRKSIQECHDQMDYSIYDQVIDFSKEENFYLSVSESIKFDDVLGKTIRNMIDNEMPTKACDILYDQSSKL